MSTRTAIQSGLVATFVLFGCSNPEYPNCDNDEHCHEGEFCVNGACQQCRGDRDCRPGQRCAGGRCEPIPGWCGSDADCAPDEECVNNRCVARRVAETPIETPQQCMMQPVYFAYDSSELDANARNTLQANAECFQSRNIARVTIVGHCDPRGTEEYNLALGHRRAQAVQGQVQRLGIPRNRTATQSMGEEMARGSDESSWARDRRADFEER
ncbi:MAG: OmpA family protein [Sandaracinaceae bacterium]|nr:OmpA family protein [Sandaracinaceae bacterium]